MLHDPLQSFEINALEFNTDEIQSKTEEISENSHHGASTTTSDENGNLTIEDNTLSESNKIESISSLRSENSVEDDYTYRMEEYIQLMNKIDPNFLLRSLVKEGSHERLKELLNSTDASVLEKIDVNHVMDQDQWTCLHEIITHGCQFNKTVEVLLQFDDVNPNIPDATGDTPLHSALRFHNLENATLLLQHKSIDLSVKNLSGRMPIHVVEDASSLEILLKHGGQKLDVNAQDVFGNTALHMAVSDRDLSRVETLLSYSNPEVGKKIKMDIQNVAGYTPLHLCSDSSIAKCIIERVYSHISEDKDSEKDIKNSIKSLVNAKDKQGNTPLHLATKRRHKDVVRVLLQHGAADVDLLNVNQKTAFNLAKDKEMKKILSNKMKNEIEDLRPASKRTKHSRTDQCSSSTSSEGELRDIESVHVRDIIVSNVDDNSEAIVTRGILKPSVNSENESSNPQNVSPNKRCASDRVTFSDKVDYSGVEIIEKRVKVAPDYYSGYLSSSSSASSFSDDDCCDDPVNASWRSFEASPKVQIKLKRVPTSIVQCSSKPASSSTCNANVPSRDVVVDIIDDEISETKSSLRD